MMKKMFYLLALLLTAALTGVALSACDKSEHMLKAEKRAEARAQENKAAHEKRNSQ
jgi:hypothetical protein